MSRGEDLAYDVLAPDELPTNVYITESRPLSTADVVLNTAKEVAAVAALIAAGVVEKIRSHLKF